MFGGNLSKNYKIRLYLDNENLNKFISIGNMLYGNKINKWDIMSQLQENKECKETKQMELPIIEFLYDNYNGYYIDNNFILIPNFNNYAECKNTWLELVQERGNNNDK